MLTEDMTTVRLSIKPSKDINCKYCKQTNSFFDWTLKILSETPVVEENQVNSPAYHFICVNNLPKY